MRREMRFLLLMLCLSSVARAEARLEKPGEKEFLGCNKYPADKKFRWGVRGEIGIPELVASLGEISCRPIVVGPTVASRGGKVMLEVPDLLTTGEVYRLFYSALEVLGLTVEESGRTIKIVDAARAREVATPQLGGQVGTGDQFVLRMYKVERAGVGELAEALARMKSKDGEVTPYLAGGSILITDRATNVRRMEEMARALDIAPPGQRIFTLGTHGQTPSELGATIDKILLAGRKPDAKGTPTPDGVSAVVPVDGARMLAVVATDAGYRRVSQLVARIDPPLPELEDGMSTQTHVLYLANTNAEDVAQTLQQLGLTSRQPQKAGSPTGIQGEVRIAADKISNALVVFAGAADFPMVRDLVNRLDVPRRQVYVEATILDVSVDKMRKIGITFHNGVPGPDGSTGFVSGGAAGFNSALIDAKTVAGALGAGGLVTGIMGKSFDFMGTSIPSFGVILQALEHSKDVNVLSRPHLLTMDNTKATLSVGQSIPFQTQAAGNLTGGQTSIISNFQRTDVALKLEITPHLNDSDSVRLELDGNIEDVPDGQTAQAGGPTTNKRTLKTSVVVKDGETVVLGGLQKETQSETVEKIPLLGDIPVLGKLFQHKSKQRSKQDLLIVLTPYVIRGPEDLRRIYEQRESERRDFIERCTAFADDTVYDANVDYKRKRGLLQEINLTALEAEHRAIAVREATTTLKRAAVEGPIGD
jgi:general secretion pathway protein D